MGRFILGFTLGCTGCTQDIYTPQGIKFNSYTYNVYILTYIDDATKHLFIGLHNFHHTLLSTPQTKKKQHPFFKPTKLICRIGVQVQIKSLHRTTEAGEKLRIGSFPGCFQEEDPSQGVVRHIFSLKLSTCKIGEGPQKRKGWIVVYQASIFRWEVLVSGRVCFY